MPDNSKSQNKPASPRRGNVILSLNEADKMGVSKAFENAGFGIYYCTTFEEFMQIEHSDLRAIVIDITSGVKGIYHTIETIKQTRVGASIPIVLTADEASSDNLLKALHAGANDYVLAPFSYNELVKRVIELI